MDRISAEDHKVLAEWAAACAERVLEYFETENPGDNRPRNAIMAARYWISAKMKTQEVRRLAFEAHAAARNANTVSAKAAARSAAHAAAAAHVASHARHAAAYALKAAGNPGLERKLQSDSLPEHLRMRWQVTTTVLPA